MSLIKLQGNASGSGAFTIAAPNSNTDRTLTLPDATGTVVTADASGNVGIGTSSPTSLGTGITTLELKGNSASQTDRAGGINFMRYDGNPGMYVYHADDASYIASLSTYPLLIQTNGTERMRIDSSGNVGIGTTSPASNLDVRGTISGEDILQLSNSAGTSDGGAENGIRATCNGNLNWANLRIDAYNTIFRQNGTERARIDSDGRFLVGTTSFSNLTGGSTAGCAFQEAGTVWGARADASGVFNRLTSNGTAVELRRQGVTVGSISVTTTATTYNTSSDYRLKENVQPMTGALDKIAQLNPVTYTWKADGSAGQGFIAHELQAVVPDCVTGEKDAVDATGNPQYQGVDTSFLVATLVKAIQELTARVAQLEAN